MVEIICPNCNFTKEVSRGNIPASAKWATCPRCKQRFNLVFHKRSIGFEKEQEGGGSPSASGKRPPPWELRPELGTWQGIYRTFKGVLLSPDTIFHRKTCRAGFLEPLAFGILFGSLGMMFGFFWQFLTSWQSVSSISPGMIGQISLSVIFFGVMIVIPLFVLITMFVVSGVMHACLLFVGGGKNGFEGTFRVIAYSQAVQIFGIVPFVGGVIGWFWQLIVQVIGLREIHGTSYLRVIIALILPFALFGLLAMALIFSLFILL